MGKNYVCEYRKSPLNIRPRYDLLNYRKQIQKIRRILVQLQLSLHLVIARFKDASERAWIS